MTNVTLLEHKKHREGKPTLYRYQECGLDNIWLLGGFRIENTPDGELLFIEDQEDLHKAIAFSIIECGDRISGRELRFLRREINLTQEHLARLLESDVQAVARWEKGKTRVPGPADRMIRYLYLNHVQDNRDVREFLETLAELDRMTDGRQVFQPTAKGWERAAA